MRLCLPVLMSGRELVQDAWAKPIRKARGLSSSTRTAAGPGSARRLPGLQTLGEGVIMAALRTERPRSAEAWRSGR